LAQHVQPNQQESLQRQIWRILDPVGTPEPPQTTTRKNNTTQAPSTPTQSKSQQISSGQTRSTVGFSSTQLTPEFVQHCERELVQVVGPVAQLVIRQILDQNAQITPIELVDALASQIPHSQRALEFRKKLLPRL
jgi:serine/threonine-protein kinase